MDSDDWPWRILLVEDNHDDQLFVRRSLKENDLQCELTTVNDGREALQLIARLDREKRLPLPHIALLDIQLPYHDGLEVLKSLRASERCGRLPTILMTDSPSAETLFKSAKKNAPSRTIIKKGYESFLEI